MSEGSDADREIQTITQQEIARLKKRRDQLLNTACTRFEWVELLDEVKEINSRLRVLHMRLAQQPAR